MLYRTHPITYTHIASITRTSYTNAAAHSSTWTVGRLADSNITGATSLFILYAKLLLAVALAVIPCRSICSSAPYPVGSGL